MKAQRTKLKNQGKIKAQTAKQAASKQHRFGALDFEFLLSFDSLSFELLN